MNNVLRNMLVKIGADNDQDRAACREWLSNATFNDVLDVWACIQREYDDPVMEIMSRFAQLAFAEMVEEHYGKCVEDGA